MTFPTFLRPALMAATLAAGALASLQAQTPVPPGFTADVHDDLGAGHGAAAKRWPGPSPVFAPDLSDATQKPGSWASNEGILTQTGDGSLWTKAAYGDFVLNLDFRCKEKASSAVIVRCTDTDRPAKAGIEVRILQGDDTEKRVVGAITDCVAPTRQIEIVPGTWYHYTITARASHIKVAIDGEQVADMNLDKWTKAKVNPDGTPNEADIPYKEMPRSGRIGLDNGAKSVEFKNVLIDRL